MAVAGAIMLLVALFVAIFAGWIAPFDPKAAVKVSIDNIYVKPGGEHLLGTDDAGKDVLSNLFYGARVSLLVGFFASFISLVIGGMIGLTAGFFGGRVDNLLMRLTDVLLVASAFTLPTGRDHKDEERTAVCCLSSLNVETWHEWSEMPGFVEDVPYVLAVVTLEEGPRMTTNIVQCAPEDVRIGLPVEVVFEDIADGISLPKFRPAT